MVSITPESLTHSINFHFHKSDWEYQPDHLPTIHKIQAEGAAHLWNVLLEKKIALLADEVGMGKTIQALAVMINLWQQKPDAKVLLFAPNENVALKWKREYENFIRYHYRHWDNLIKSALNGAPLRRAIYCENHIELLQQCSQKWPSLFICKTSSLSNFISPKITIESLEDVGIYVSHVATDKSNDADKIKWVHTLGKKSNELIQRLFSKADSAPFDLLIFDEAHYLRRSDGHSFRSIAAHSFFAGRDIYSPDAWDTHKPIADKVLLLTATPNHSATEDINNITGLFAPGYKKKDAITILRDLCVRRFRRLEGKTKHDYREELAEGVEMTSLRERLFFAAYHKALVAAKAASISKDQKKKQDNPYRILFGYLEGFEFLPQQTESQGNSQIEGTDFNHREDAEVIVRLSQLYKNVYSERPEHPKYKKITEVLTPLPEDNFSAEKKLVFVRRIASVYEIGGRMIEIYDGIFKQLLHSLFNSEELLQLEKNPRSFFYNLIRDEDIEEDEIVLPTTENEDKERIRDSDILSLFTIRKEGRYRSTDCSNFRVRFQKNDQFFSILFEPGLLYDATAYQLNRVEINSKSKRQYKSTIQKLRLSQIADADQTKIALEQAYGLTEENNSVDTGQLRLPTLITIWLSYPPEESATLIREARETYKAFNYFEKEGFSQYLEKGLLFSSQYIVRFYKWFREITHNKDIRGEELYLAFCEKTREEINTSGLGLLIAKAALSFSIFYQKELGLTPSQLPTYTWPFLNFTLPVYPYCGETRRESIIKAFNSPFYPDVLIATSVLQEGVDLHYHCAEVIHYGIAWTQGDNEQRVGRVDRMFGKLENQLKKNETASLPIHYPFLRNTIDQDQVGRFVVRKHESEKLLDQLKNVQFNNEINFKERISEETWRALLNTPGKQQVEHDPYPIDYKQAFSGITTPFITGLKTDDLGGFLNPLWNSLHSHFGDDFILYKTEKKSGQQQNQFAIKHIRPNHRHQPILGEIGYSEKGLYFLQKPVYFIRITTPITKRLKNLQGINTLGLIKNTYNDYPLLKICCNKEVKTSFRFHICADLPLFRMEDQHYNISQDELIHTIETVIRFSDDLENKIFGDRVDIQNEEVIEDTRDSWQIQRDVNLTKDRGTKIRTGWKKNVSGNHLYKEKGYRIFEDYIDIYKFNHEYHFIRKINTGNQTWLQAGLYLHDALEEECLLLEKIIEATFG